LRTQSTPSTAVTSSPSANIEISQQSAVATTNNTPDQTQSAQVTPATPDTLTTTHAITSYAVNAWQNNPIFANIPIQGGGNANLPPNSLPGAFEPKVNQHPKFGMNFTNYFNSYSAARAAGSSFERVEFAMKIVNPSLGSFDFRTYDTFVVNPAAQQNIRVLGVLGNPPDWAGDKRFAKKMWWVPANLHLAWNDPQNYWGQFVYKSALHYKGRITAWEVWNEPNIDFWTAPPEVFAQLLKVSYFAIKAADPNAIVVFGGIFHYNNYGFIQDTFKSIANMPDASANRSFFDAMAHHPYDLGICQMSVEGDVIDNFLRRDMRAYLPNEIQNPHPIWVTETGIRVRDQPYPEFATPEEQASYLIASFAYALDKGAQRIYYFRTNDADNTTTEPWGLLKNDGTQKPGYNAFKVASQWLPSTHLWSTRNMRWTNGVRRISFYGTNLGRVSVIWNASRNTVSYDFPATQLKTATVIEQDGKTYSVLPSNGNVRFVLPPAQNWRWNRDYCQVPSKPIIIVENDTTPPVGEIAPLPSVITTTDILLTWSGRDEPTGATAGLKWWDLQYRIVEPKASASDWILLLDREESLSYRFTGQPNTTYEFRVRAHDAAGNPQSTSTMKIVSVTFASELATPTPASATPNPITATPTPSPTPIDMSRFVKKLYMPMIHAVPKIQLVPTQRDDVRRG
jgi:hypothetical protein